MTRRWRIVPLACLLLPAPAWAADKGKPRAVECSAEPAPDGKLVLRIDDQAIPLTVATIRSQQERRRNGQAEAPRSLEVDRELESRGLFDR